MAHHLARSAKRKKEYPMCGATPLDTHFKCKNKYNISLNQDKYQKT